MFDLNYVGCEPGCGLFVLSDFRRFDLNYVGCEHADSGFARGLMQGLIWTMWDVNAVNMEFLFVMVQVWSELCGMWTLTDPAQRDARKLSRLIWTMWDVNVRFLAAVRCSISCLIWTMWDVNQKYTDIDGKCIIEFDLNYVGCERSNQLDERSDHKRVWSELCGMWTSTRKRKRAND